MALPIDSRGDTDWQTAAMAKILYTAEAHVTGGRDEGHGKTSDGELEVDIRIPKELGGDGGGTNPEQLFAVGYASCFESAIKVVGMRMKEDVGDVEIDSKVHLMPTEDRGFGLAVELDVSLPSVDDAAKAVEIVEAAHKVCPYSNATRGNIDVDLTANGEKVS
jgi:Ohr subfamily peroxiredoxin